MKNKSGWFLVLPGVLLLVLMDVRVASAGGDVASLVKELNVQLERAEKERLADPWFIKDLRGLVRKYDYPWGKQVLLEDFSERAAAPPAPWEVTSGEFLVDWRHGLRSVVEIPVARPAASTEKEDDEDVASALLGALLKEALKEKGKPQSQPSQQQDAPGSAQVLAPVPFGAAFSANIKLSSRGVGANAGGVLEFGPYQGKSPVDGYRLVYRPGSAETRGSLELVSLTTRGGRATVERFGDPVELEDGKIHELVWTRDRDSHMAVTLDGVAVFAVTDRGFRNDFAGFAFANLGGDYAIREFRLETAE